MIVILMFAVAGKAAAQTDAQRISDLENKLQNALEVIDKLSSKVDHLEKAKDSPAAAKEQKQAQTATTAVPATPAVAMTPEELAEPPSYQNDRIKKLESKVTQLSSSASSRIIPFDWLHAFMDVGGGYSSNGHPQGFGVGSLDLYITPNLGAQVKTLAELVFEYEEDGSLLTDLERAQIGYAFNDHATVWLGRFHTPFGYWQTAYHHGLQIQPSLLRPRFIDFEDKGGLLATHTIGVWGTGGYKMQGGKWIYDVYAGNAPEVVGEAGESGGSLDPDAAGFDNPNLTVGGRFGYNFSGGTLDGLNVGVNGLHSTVNIATGNIPGSQVDLNMIGGYLYYNNFNWEVISEIYGFINHDNQTRTGTHNSWAGFAHVGYQLDRWMPYARLEKADTNKNDPYFRSMTLGNAYAREALGLRFDINTQSALKLELNYTQPESNDNRLLKDFWESRVQYAVRF